MRTVKLKDVLRFEMKPFLLGLLFSRIKSIPESAKVPEQFYVYTSFKSSKAVFKSDFSLKAYAEELVEQYNAVSGYENWEIHKATDSSVQLRLYIENDLQLTVEECYMAIHKKLLSSSDWLYKDELTEEKKSFLRGYMETRGSIDLTAKMIAQDYFYNNKFELKRVQILTDMLNLPISYANFNPRHMQPDYVSGKNKRNSQFRINVFFYAKEIGFINKYKAKIFENTYKPEGKYVKDGVIYYEVNVPEVNNSIYFIKYLNFFTNNIYNKELTTQKVKQLRDEIGFTNASDLDKKKQRNRTIIEIFDNISEDRCAQCGTTETFTKKTNGRQGFEIHHMISYHNGRQYDNIANLVKLCPTCHSSLKRGRASKEEQISNITKILDNHPEVYEYTSSTLGINHMHELAEEIWTLLG